MNIIQVFIHKKQRKLFIYVFIWFSMDVLDLEANY